MKRLFLIAMFLLLTVSLAAGQEARYLSSALEVFVFPSQGQTSDQQLIEEGECYDWAVERTGVDPFDLRKQQQEQAKQAEAAKAQAGKVGKGAGATGAVGGAAAGALIGGVARGSKGARRGAAAGAVLGGLAGASARREARKQAGKQVEAQAQQQQRATEGQMENFKKAFGVCMESKGYMVR